MDSSNARQMLTKPQIQRLKQMTDGLRVGRVLGDRVLVKVVTPFTEMDRLEKSGLLVVPETARDEHTPLPTTGIVVAIGVDASIYEHDLTQPFGIGTPLLREGDMIMFSKYAGCDVYFNEEAFRIMETREILCTLEATEPAEIIVLPVNEASAPPEVGA